MRINLRTISKLVLSVLLLYLDGVWSDAYSSGLIILPDSQPVTFIIGGYAKFSSTIGIIVSIVIYLLFIASVIWFILDFVGSKNKKGIKNGKRN